MKTKLYILASAISLSLTIGCSEKAASEATTEQPKQELKERNSIVLSDKQLSLSEIETGYLTEKEISHIVTGNGFLELPPENLATVSLPIAGRIAKVYVTVGDKVQKGQTIAEVEHPEHIMIQKEYLENRSNFETAQKEYIRISELSADNISSQKQLQEAEARYHSAKAAKEASQASLALLQIDPEDLNKNGIKHRFAIKAPISGSVTSTSLNIGKSVSPGESLFEMIDKSHMHVNLQIFESDLPNISLGDSVRFNLISHPEEQFKAFIQYIGERVDPGNRSVEIIAHIKEPKDVFKEGMYVNGAIHTQKRTVLTLPETALINRDNKWFAFVRKGNTFQDVEVHKGGEMDGYAEILNPQAFTEGTPIVTRGAYYVETELEKTEE
ncbi:MAG: efflux RND transporter periplasmic adaptor subunit [Bacteroidales bacterium]